MDLRKDFRQNLKYIVLSFVGLYAIVNNAGIQKLGRISWQTMEDLQKVMDVNFWGTVRTTKAMLPLLAHGKGRIINISSSAGMVFFIS